MSGSVSDTLQEVTSLEMCSTKTGARISAAVEGEPNLSGAGTRHQVLHVTTKPPGGAEVVYQTESGPSRWLEFRVKVTSGSVLGCWRAWQTVETREEGEVAMGRSPKRGCATVCLSGSGCGGCGGWLCLHASVTEKASLRKPSSGADL